MNARLKFDGRETEIAGTITVFGRAEDCEVAFPGNPNISRRHAQLEIRPDGYFLTDLGSSNGTSVNGQAVAGETRLSTGDFITLGNAVIVEFLTDEEPESEPGGVQDPNPPAADSPSSRKSLVVGIAGAACGLAVISVAAAFAVPYMMSSSCDAVAVFESPENGDVVTEETEVSVQVSGSGCVERVILTLGGKEVASMADEPYATKIDGGRFADFADGGTYPLGIVLEDSYGNRTVQGQILQLAFETRQTEDTAETAGADKSGDAPAATGPLSASETQQLTEAFMKKVSTGGAKYRIAGGDFFSQVQRYSGEYAVEGYFARASSFRDLINQSFVRERNIDPTLAYVLAFSRSKFSPARSPGGEGLWQMTQEFAAANFYNAGCGQEGLSDAGQKCAAEAAALHVQDLAVKVFEGDAIYAVAAFGKSPKEADAWKSKLPPDRSEFWRHISDAKAREQVARFVAAGVVAENPQKFGLSRDRPIYELYPPTRR